MNKNPDNDIIAGQKTVNAPDESNNNTPEGNGRKKTRHHLIRSAWIRIPLKTLVWTLVAVILIPVLLYIPPIQDALVDFATAYVGKKTGIKVEIGKLRLKFPLDVSLQNLTVIQQNGDTMVNAREAVADIKLLPLLNLDVKVKRLRLLDGYYRMVSPDSSMTMGIRAGFLEVDDKTQVSISSSDINLHHAILRDGDISLHMDVWKKKPSPQDTTSTPFLINVDCLDAERITFAMSMLPTIDTLRLSTPSLAIRNAIIDLRANTISARSLNLDGGAFSYITPTAEYIKTHPAPVDTISPPSPPMTITADSISIAGIKGLYATSGASPLPGFDASYIDVSDVSVKINNFYNRASTVRLPVQSLTARERCGLHITQGSGTVTIDSLGLALDRLRIHTPYTSAAVTATVPFALMALKPEAPVEAEADLSIGLPDVEAFMPSLAPSLRQLPRRSPLTASVIASGTLDNLRIPRLNAAMKDFFSIRASGNARNALDIRRLVADLDIDGELRNPAPAKALAGIADIDIPPFSVKGSAKARGQAYSADISLVTPQGDVAAKGGVSLTAETYMADIKVHNVNVGHFMPDAGIGHVSAYVKAEGAGFNPTRPRAHTDIEAAIASLEYHKATLRDISLQARLADSNYAIKANSPNRILDIDLDLKGHLKEDDYAAQGYLKCRHADLRALGLDSVMNEGNFDMTINASASPDRWLYDAKLQIDNLDWNLPDQYIHMPTGVHADLLALADRVTIDVSAPDTRLAFSAEENLKVVIDRFSKATDITMRQIDGRRLAIDTIQEALPRFNLTLDASGKGLMKELLLSSGLDIDSLSLNLSNDSLFHGNADILHIRNKSLAVDSLSMVLAQRGSLLDYRIHAGNRPGTLDEFARVDLNGYVGSNRISAFLTQRNIDNETGYRLGLTAAMMDSTLSVHFTPLKSTLAYMPWTLNQDNFIDINLSNLDVDANLMASSHESSILVETAPDAENKKELHLNLSNIRIEDFLRMSVLAPPVTATINSDLHLRYDNSDFTGKGTLDVADFTYENVSVGDFNLGLDAGMLSDGSSQAAATLKINNRDAATLKARLTSQKDSVSGQSRLQPEYVRLALTGFPLSVANAFLGASTASLSGGLSGELDMTGHFNAPVLNGSIACDSVKIFIPMTGSALRLSDSPLTVSDNVVRFEDFSIFGANDNPLTINGSVDASSFSDINLDLNAAAREMMLINNDQRAGSDLFGKLLLDMTASVKGPLSHFDINTDLNILGKTDITYNVPQTAATLQASGNDNVVKFVNLSDTTATAAADSVPRHMLMRIQAGVTISPGTLVKVNASSPAYSAKVSLSPSGSLNYYQNYMGDMTLNGQLNTGPGSAKVSVKVMAEKDFRLDPASYILWNGQIANPVLDIKATDTQKVNVMQNGNSHMVNFLVSLQVSNTLSAPRVIFDLAADDDMSIQNQLQGMSADQRSAQAMNLLITGQYTAEGVTTDRGPLMGNVYNMLASQLNALAAKSIRGVDLSFGIDQYDKTLNGESSTTTSYSYQVSKSLFNNRFKINVGGNYATDASADENLAENLISDISFEYIFKQTQSLSIYGKLFRHNSYESILEGEITETGLGFVMTRKLGNLKNLFRFRRRKKQPAPADSLQREPVAADSLRKETETSTQDASSL